MVWQGMHLLQLVEGEGLLAMDVVERLAVHRARKLLAPHLRRGIVVVAVVAVRGGICGERPASVGLRSQSISHYTLSSYLFFPVFLPLFLSFQPPRADEMSENDCQSQPSASQSNISRDIWASFTRVCCQKNCSMVGTLNCPGDLSLMDCGLGHLLQGGGRVGVGHGDVHGDNAAGGGTAGRVRMAGGVPVGEGVAGGVHSAERAGSHWRVQWAARRAAGHAPCAHDKFWCYPSAHMTRQSVHGKSQLQGLEKVPC